MALTRHRDGVQVYTDRQTFADRDHLDRSLSRAPSKDLARDYAAAEIERHATRYASLADQVRGLRDQWHEIASSAATIQDVSTTASQLSDARATLAKAAARVYANPSQALERLAADSQAPARLRIGQAAAYGQLNGRAATRFRQPNLAHQTATAYVPALRNALENCHEADRGATRAQALASTISESLPKLREQLVQLSRTIQRVEQAMRGPENAIEAIVREVGPRCARLALSALPRAFHPPVELAIRAVENVMDLGLGLGR
jgi:hypothetical protein